MFTLKEIRWLKEAVFNELCRYSYKAPTELYQLLDKLEGIELSLEEESKL